MVRIINMEARELTYSLMEFQMRIGQHGSNQLISGFWVKGVGVWLYLWQTWKKFLLMQ